MIIVVCTKSTKSPSGQRHLYALTPPYQGLGELDYPWLDWAATVTRCGRICFKKRKVNLSQVFAGQTVGVKQVADRAGW